MVQNPYESPQTESSHDDPLDLDEEKERRQRKFKRAVAILCIVAGGMLVGIVRRMIGVAVADLGIQVLYGEAVSVLVGLTLIVIGAIQWRLSEEQ